MNNICYYTLKSLTLGRKRRVNFQNQVCDIITADYRIIMSRILKVTGNHLNFARFVLQNVTSIFSLFQGSQGVKGSASAGNLYFDLYYSGYHKNLVQ